MGGSSSSHRGSEVRIGHSLNKDEEAFVARRRKTVLHCLQRLQIHHHWDDEANVVGGGQRAMPDVPNIALLGSGGGQRAMVGLLGSLVELDKAGLLDCILYLSGVSGSTWCMASLYKEPDWSTKLETVKNKIIKRLNGPAVSFTETFEKLKKYHKKDFFSLTDVWAVLAVTEYVKEINEHTLTDQWNNLSKDPFPIYTLIDKQCKQQGDGDPWFEISPYEAGYSLTGAFVDTSNFGSQFDNGSKKNHQDEFDMLYLQALCGSAIADEKEILKFIWEQIKDFFTGGKWLGTNPEVGPVHRPHKVPTYNSGPVGKHSQVLTDLANMNLCVLNGDDPSDLDQSIRTTLKDLGGGKDKKKFPMEKLDLTKMEHYNNHVLSWLSAFPDFGLDSGSIFTSDFWEPEIVKWVRICNSISKCINQWNWGKNHNFLYNITDETVPSTLLESETRDYEDAGLLLNSPYFSVLRKERDIDLIISLDFSDGDPFMTVREAAEMCKKLNIPFPEVNIPSEDVNKPKDFYVFKGQNAPTVIHIPLFNVVNCGDEVEGWRYKYGTFQRAYSADMIADLMEVAGINISNNREKLLEQIHVASITKLFKSIINTFHKLCRLRLRILANKE